MSIIIKKIKKNKKIKNIGTFIARGRVDCFRESW
jgi:hypothetical protein